MKRKLLLLFIGMLFSVSAFAQVTANPVADLSQCGNEIFDLTVTEAAALGNQSPATHTVTWHSSLADADNGTNPIVDPTVYIGVNGEIIYLRVTNSVDDSYGTTSFALEITTGFLDDFPDVTVCDAYTLPALSVGNYYWSPSGQGNVIPAGFVVLTTAQIYVYADNGTCVDEDSFIVTITPTPDAPLVSNVTACNDYTLPALPLNYSYNTAPGGTGTTLVAGTAIVLTTTIYVIASNGACETESSFTVTINPLAPGVEVNDVVSCAPYTLPPLPGNAVYTLQIDNGPITPVGTVIYETTTVFVYEQGVSCQQISSFTVTIGDIEYNLPDMITCSDGTGGTFDFSVIQAQVGAINSNAVITVFGTMVDAEMNANALPMMYTSAMNLQTVYLRIQNSDSGCYSIQSFTLRVMACTNSIISGTVTFDDDGNGCDTSDTGLQGILMVLSSNGQQFLAYTNAAGQYQFENVYQGFNFVMTAHSTLPEGSVITPSHVQSVQITGDGQAEVLNFCVSDQSGIPDVEVSLIAVSPARPGVNAYYHVQIQNNSNASVSGAFTLSYDDSRLNFLNSVSMPTSQASGSLTWSYTNIPAYGWRGYQISFLVETPPTATAGDVLNFTANLSQADGYEQNNTSSIEQIIVDSYDPNDITALEGDIITPVQATSPLHYLIRFQNTGTADALNVKIENAMSPMLNWNTFRPVASSHTYFVNRTGNQFTFRFPDINLPAEQDDEPGSHGFILYEITPTADIQIGDSIENQAEIFFDFNAAIVTNTAITTVAQLSTPQNETADFVLYPNPTSGKFTIRCSEANGVSIEISDVRGSKVLAETLETNQSEASVDVSHLQSGMYFVRIISGGTSFVKKLMVK